MREGELRSRGTIKAEPALFTLFLFFNFDVVVLQPCRNHARNKKKKLFLFSQHPANTKAAMSQPCQCLTHVCHKHTRLLGMSMLTG